MRKSLLIVKLLTVVTILLSGKSFAQCTATITGDTLVCVGGQATLNATVLGPDNELQASVSAGNNHRGNMFDITATNEVTILSFDASPMGNTTIEIYYKTGTWNGFANDPAAWTFIGSAPVTYTGALVPVPVSVNVTIPAGQTYAFYVTSNTSAVSLNYSNGTTVGNVYSSDANITFLEGGGMEYPFTQNTGAVYQPRVWNGKIHYALSGLPTTYSWNTMETTASIQPTINTPSQYTVESTIAGCPTLYDTVSVWTSIPTISAGTDQSICMGDSLLLDASGNAAIYTWDNGITDSVFFSPSMSATYIATATDSIGCTATDTAYVTVNTLPAVSAGVDFDLCIGDTAVMSGQGADIYLWDNGISDNSPFVPVATNQYVVTGIDGNGCSNTDTIEVIVNLPPMVSAGADQEICIGSETTLSGSGADSYIWNNGVTDGVPFGPTTTEDYIVIGTDVNGCSASDTVTVNTHAISAPISVSGTVLVTALNPGGTLQWYNCDSQQIIIGETNFTYTPTTTGNYAVIVTNSELCSDTSNCILVDFTGIEENNTSAFNVFPNPTNDNITVNSSAATIDKVEVLDLLGNVLYTEEIGLLSTTIDLSTFEGKQFLIRVFNEDKAEVIKVLKF